MEAKPAMTRMPGGKERHILFMMVFLMYAFSYGDRAALSIALPTLSHDFSLTSVEIGWLSSSFLWSYIALNLPSSIVADMYGARLVGAWAVALWSGAMVLGGMTRNLFQFILTRVMLGAGEAPAFGIGAGIIREWAKPQERAVVTTGILCGMQTGLALGTIAGAWLLIKFGWRAEFIILGAIGFVWVLFWLRICPRPSESSGNTERPKPISLREIRALFRSPSFVSILVAQSCSNYLNFLVMSWLPLFLVRALHLDVMHAGTASAVCYALAAFGSIFIGHAAERIMFRKERKATARRFVVAPLMMVGAVIALVPFVSSTTATIVLIAIAVGGTISGNGANMAMLADLLDDHRKIASVSGLILTFSNCMGTIAPIATGYIVAATGSFNAGWYACAVALLTGGSLSLLLVRKPIIISGTEPDASPVLESHAAL